MVLVDYVAPVVKWLVAGTLNQRLQVRFPVRAGFCQWFSTEKGQLFAIAQLFTTAVHDQKQLFAYLVVEILLGEK